MCLLYQSDKMLTTHLQNAELDLESWSAEICEPWENSVTPIVLAFSLQNWYDKTAIHTLSNCWYAANSRIFFFFKSVALLNNITESETRLEEMSSPQGFPNLTLFQVDRNIYLMFSSANYCAKFEAIKAPLIISKSKKDFVKYLGKQRTVSLAP